MAAIEVRITSTALIPSAPRRKSIPSTEIHAFEPEAAAEYVEANEKVYRLATAYDIPDEVGQM